MNKSVLIITLAFSMLLLGCLGFGEETPPEINETVDVVNETQPAEVIEKPPPNVTMKEGVVRVRIGSQASQIIGKGLESLNLTIVKIELFNGNDWIIIGSETKTFELVQLSGKTEVYASKNISVGNYSKMRLTLVSARGSVITGAPIPGILSTKKVNDLDLSDYRPELDINLELSEETQIVKLRYNLEKIDLTEFEYLNTREVSITIESLAICSGGCETACTNSNTFSGCIDVCNLDKETDCENDTKLSCAVKCGCDLSCETFQQEECRLDCIKTGNSNSSECRLSIPGACNETCKQEPVYTTCFNRCEAKC